MKYILIIVYISLSLCAKAQPRYNAALLDTLLQIRQTNTIAKHFANLYYKAIEITNGHAHVQTEPIKQFILGFESSFGPLFFKSYNNYINNVSQEFSWQRYYKDTSLNELQYLFIGMNAHINGDMWWALKNKYNYDTLYKYKKSLIGFQKKFNIFFDSIYATTFHLKKIRQLHHLTLGLDKAYGRKMVLRWRTRQVKLALLWYSNNHKCLRRVKRLQKQMQRFDRFAIKYFK
jgi:Family of unknown function (DUF5995)